MSYEGEPNEKPQIYGDPSEDDTDWECMAYEHSGSCDDHYGEDTAECPNCGEQIFIDRDGQFDCEICGLTGYYYDN